MATRTLTDTATITWDEATANQVKGNVVANSIGNTLLADMAQSTFKGRPAGAGTGDPTDLTEAQVKTILSFPIVTVDNTVPRYDGTTGNMQTSGLLIDDSNNLSPVTNDVGALGTTSLKWADAFLASGAVVNFNSGDVTITHSANLLTFAGASSGYSFDATIALASATALNWNAGNVTITQSVGALAFGGSAGVAVTMTYTGADGVMPFVVDTGSSSLNNSAALTVIVPTTGAQKAFQLTFPGAAAAWASVELNVGGAGKPGLALGPGSAVRDVNIYRDAADVLKTDDSFALAAGTATLAPLKFSSGTSLTTPVAGVMEYDGKTLYSTPNASNRAVNTPTHFLSLSANQTGTDVNTAQPWFPGGGATGLTVAASTSYLMEGLLIFDRTAGTTAHTIGQLFAGTATLTSIGYQVIATNLAAALPPAGLTAPAGTQSAVATNTLIVASNSTAEQHVMIYLKGIVRINGAGTFIPQFIYSAAPGGAPTIRANSYFTMVPIGSDTVLSVGNWS